MNVSFIHIVHALIIVQSLLFAFVVFVRRHETGKGKKFLGILLLVLGVHFLYNFLHTALPASPAIRYIIQFSPIFGYFYGPLLYLHIKGHLNADFTFWKKQLLHFAPVPIVLFCILFHIVDTDVLGKLIVLQIFVYTVLGFKELKHYEQAIQQLSSINNTGELRWLRFLVLLTLLIIVIDGIQQYQRTITIGSFTFKLEFITQLLLLVLVNGIVFEALKNPTFFKQLNTANDPLPDDVEPLPGNYNPALITELEMVMEQKKPYLNPALPLNTLAALLSIPPRRLSQLINQHYNKNFSEYINNYRIEYARDIILKNEDPGLTMMEVMYEAGFISRSVFNTMFKHKFGQTPSAFKQVQLKNKKISSKS